MSSRANGTAGGSARVRPRRRTIAREADVAGPGLHEGQVARVRLHPAPAGTGIRIRRSDVAGSEPVPVHIEFREERARRTAIRRGAAEVHTVEHLMAAVLGLGITDLDVEVDRVEMPGLDGSALGFLDALEGAGLVDLEGEAPVVRLGSVVEVADAGGARIVALPCPGRLVLEYMLDYGGDCPRSRVALEVAEASFRAEIAPARTFCLEREALALRAAGLGRGATTQNTLVIGKDGLPLENRLRFQDEYARHKALDLLGDLALLGARLEARVIACKAGHTLNAALVRRLVDLGGGGGPDCPKRAIQGGDAGISPPDCPKRAIQEEAVERFVPPGSAFDGHFPGDPVLPGVVALSAMRGGESVRAVEGIKFRKVVRPGEALEIERAPTGDGRVRARARSAGEVVVEGVLVPAGGR